MQENDDDARSFVGLAPVQLPNKWTVSNYLRTGIACTWHAPAEWQWRSRAGRPWRTWWVSACELCCASSVGPYTHKHKMMYKSWAKWQSQILWLILCYRYKMGTKQVVLSYYIPSRLQITYFIISRWFISALAYYLHCSVPTALFHFADDKFPVFV